PSAHIAVRRRDGSPTIILNSPIGVMEWVHRDVGAKFQTAAVHWLTSHVSTSASIGDVSRCAHGYVWNATFNPPARRTATSRRAVSTRARAFHSPWTTSTFRSRHAL